MFRDPTIHAPQLYQLMQRGPLFGDQANPFQGYADNFTTFTKSARTCQRQLGFGRPSSVLGHICKPLFDIQRQLDEQLIALGFTVQKAEAP